MTAMYPQRVLRNFTTRLTEQADVLMLNSYLSLRISEVLGIKRKDIELKKHNDREYYEITFYEFKKDRTRVVIVRESTPMQVVRYYLNLSGEEELFTTIQKGHSVFIIITLVIKRYTQMNWLGLECVNIL